MIKVKCEKCGTICKKNIKFCPNCGASMEGAPEIEKKQRSTKLPVFICVVIVILAAIGIAAVVIPNLNPGKKYRTLMAEGKTEEASSLYEEKIAADEELAESLKNEEVEKIRQIYEQYRKNEIDYDEARSEIKPYCDSELSGKQALSLFDSLKHLKDSRDTFDSAQQAETDGNLEQALARYKNVAEADENYKIAKEKITELSAQIKENYISEAETFAQNKQFKEAIASIRKAVSKVGTDDELEQLEEEYETRKDEQYVKVVVADKTVTPRNIYARVYSDRVNFVFDVTNNGEKDIKGIEGTLTVYDLFGKEIISMGCDFTGQTIASGETCRYSNLGIDCQVYEDEKMKLYNTDYGDLQFKYEASSIVFGDGTSVKPN